MTVLLICLALAVFLQNAGPARAQQALPLEVQIDLAMVQLERAVANGDHASVLDLIDRLRALSPSHGAGEVLFFEAEAAIALEDLDRAETALTQFAATVGRSSELYTAALGMMLDLPRLRSDDEADVGRPSGEIKVHDWIAEIFEAADEPEDRYCSAMPQFEPRASMTISRRGEGWNTFIVFLSGHHEELSGYRLRIDEPEGRTGSAHYTIGPTPFFEDGVGQLSFDTPHEQEAFVTILEQGDSAAILTPQGSTILGTFSLRGAAQSARMVLNCEF